MKLDKRFSNRYLFGVSYALTNRDAIERHLATSTTTSPTDGPARRAHLLNVSALVDLPGNIQLGIISAMASARR